MRKFIEYFVHYSAEYYSPQLWYLEYWLIIVFHAFVCATIPNVNVGCVFELLVLPCFHTIIVPLLSPSHLPASFPFIFEALKQKHKSTIYFTPVLLAILDCLCHSLVRCFSWIYTKNTFVVMCSIWLICLIKSDKLMYVIPCSFKLFQKNVFLQNRGNEWE